MSRIPSSRSILYGLQAHHFRHPIDEQATRALQVFPGLNLLIQNLVAPSVEQLLYVDNLASSIQVNETQLPDVHQLLVDASTILDLDVPQLYIKQNPNPNAYTFAMRGKQPFIVVHTSLLDLLEPDEIQAVLAHELGHLKCNHGVYLTIANMLVLSAGLLPLGGVLLQQTLQEQLTNWVQCAEFSCDRAALLVTQQSETVVSVLMKLCGGSPKLASQLNVSAFLEQARRYDDLDRDDWQATLKKLQSSGRSHPVPVLRAREIDRWEGSQMYRGLLEKR